MHSRASFDDIVPIVPDGDPNGKMYFVYRGVIGFHSPHFNAMLNGPFLEGDADLVELPSITADDFQMFYDWMNTGVITFKQSDTSANDTQTKFSAIIRLYIFADYHQIWELRNQCLDEYLRHKIAQWCLQKWVTDQIYASTPENDALRKLHVDLFRELWQKGNKYAQYIHDMSNEFLVDYMIACYEHNAVPGRSRMLPELGKTGWIKQKMGHFCERYHKLEAL
jgi:hypothetical protein